MKPWRSILRRSRSLFAVAVVTALLFTPALITPNQSGPDLSQSLNITELATGCPDTVAGKRLMANSTEVVQTGPRTFRYEMQPGAPMRDTAPVGYVMKMDNGEKLRFVNTAANQWAASPWSANYSNREYRYQAHVFIGRTISIPCSGQDAHWFESDTFSQRRTVSPVGSPVDTPSDFDVVAGLEVLSGSTWTRPWGLKRFHGDVTTGCPVIGTPHYLPDGSAWIRTWLWMDVGFWKYPDFNVKIAASARKTASYSLLPGSNPEVIASNSGSGGFSTGGANPAPGQTIYNCEAGP